MSDVAPQPVIEVAATEVVKPSLSGLANGTIVRTPDGHFEKIVHEVDGQGNEIAWHKEAVNEDGTPVVPAGA